MSCSMLESGTPGLDGTRKKFRPVPAVPCFLVGHWIVPFRLSRVFSEKTRDSRDGTIQCTVPVVCLKILICVFISVMSVYIPIYSLCVTFLHYHCEVNPFSKSQVLRFDVKMQMCRRNLRHFLLEGGVMSLKSTYTPEDYLC